MQKKGIKKILAILSILYLTAALIVSLPAFVLFQSGELLSVEAISRFQVANKNTLWGAGYNDPRKKQKLVSSVMRKPQILALGNSRILPIRDSFFKPEYSFYNAGNGVKILSQFKVFIENIEYKPELLILSIDDFMFAPGWTNLDDTLLGKNIFIEKSFIDILDGSYQSVYKDYIKGKYTLSGLMQKDPSILGFNAIFKQSGFRSDGSWYYGGYIKDSLSNPDLGFKSTKMLIEKGESHYIHAQKPRQEAFSELSELLAYCSKNNIKIIGVMTPYAPSMYQLMNSMPEKYAYKKNLFERIEGIFNQYGYSIYNFSDAQLLNGTDAEFLDGHHGGERISARMMNKLAESVPYLNQSVNQELINLKLNSSNHPLYIFEN